MADGDRVTAATEPPGDPSVRVGRYVVGRALGATPRGDRHAATDPTTDRRVAIVRLHGDLTAADAAALRGLAHPGIVPILDAGSAGGRGYVVTAIVDGAPIDRWARDREPARIVAAFRAAGRGLAAAHAAGVVHGAVAAASIVVDGDGIARVTDFVAAAPPDASAAADQHAFATALADALAAAGAAAVPRRVGAALDRARAHDPAARFPAMAGLVDALAPSRRGLGLAIAGAVAIAAVVAAVAWPRAPAPAPGAVAPPPAGPPRADLAAAYPLTAEPGNCAAAPIVLASDTVVYDRTDGADVNLYSIALPDGAPVAVTDEVRWAWRANRGRHPREAVYVVTDPTRQLPSRINVAMPGRNTVILSEMPTAEVNDAVALDDGVLYAAADGIHLLDARGDRLYRRAPAGQQVLAIAISNDDRWLAINSIRADRTSVVCAIEIQTARLDCIDHEVTMGRPAFGRAGWLYFSARDGVWGHDERTGTTARVVPGMSAPGGLAVTADGRALVVSRCEPQRRIVDARTSPPAVAVDDASAPSLAADDTLAYLVEHGADAAELFVRFPDGRVVQLGMPEGRAGEGPAISPDGRRVAYAGAAPRRGIGIAGTGDAEPARLTDGDDRAPRWVDDDRVVFTRVAGGGAASIYVVPARGGTPALVAEHAAGLAVRRGQVLVVRGGVTAWHDLATGRERAAGLPAGIVDATVAPSGRWLAYETGDRQVWRVDLDAGSPATSMIAVPPTQIIAHLAVGDDGRVLVERIAWTGELVVVPAAAGSRF